MLVSAVVVVDSAVAVAGFAGVEVDPAAAEFAAVAVHVAAGYFMNLSGKLPSGNQ